MPTSKDALESLTEAVEAYNHAFRWKTYDQAVLFLPEDLRGPFLAAYEDDESSLQIEDYKIARVLMKSKTAAEVTVRVRYMVLPSVVVQRATLKQYWHEVGGRWILETEENSIRTLDPSKAPPEDATLAPVVSPEQEGDTELEVFGPGDAPPPAASEEGAEPLADPGAP